MHLRIPQYPKIMILLIEMRPMKNDVESAFLVKFFRQRRNLMDNLGAVYFKFFSPEIF